MLVYNPKDRISAEAALAAPYLAPYHDETDEPVAEEKFDWSFNDADLPVDTWKIMMWVAFCLSTSIRILELTRHSGIRRFWTSTTSIRAATSTPPLSREPGSTSKVSNKALMNRVDAALVAV